jgi:CRISPR/Cas system-associated exonuclease Cas4 (RecB family)
MENYISIIKNAQQQMTSRENSISITELAFCLRKAVFSRIDPMPMTDEELFIHVSGQIGHEVIRKYFMMYPDRFRSEVEVRYEQVRGRIDIHDTILNNIVDFKTSKSQKVLLKPFKFHEQQVKFYMAIMGSNEGQIIYQMNNFNGYRVFPIYMNAEERKAVLQELKSEAQLLRNAIDAADPFLVKGIDNDRDMNWMCRKCPYVQKCLPT